MSLAVDSAMEILEGLDLDVTDWEELSRRVSKKFEELSEGEPEDDSKFKPGDRVLWKDDGDNHYGVILTERDEVGAYQVAFDDFPGKDTPAYEDELHKA